MKTTLSGSKMKSRRASAKGFDSIYDIELDLNAIDVSICNAKNMMNKEFPRLEELWSILEQNKKNAHDSMRLSRESCSNEIDEGDLQYEKHAEQRSSAF
jgi:hypothetical protein